MAFNATSRVTSWDGSTEFARLGNKEGRWDGGVTGEDGVERRSRRVRWSSGTCHVARWDRQTGQVGVG